MAASYERVLTALREVLGEQLTPSFEAKLFGENAQRMYLLQEHTTTSLSP